MKSKKYAMISCMKKKYVLFILKTITLYATITCNLRVIISTIKQKICKIASLFKTSVLSNGQYKQS